MKILLFIFSGNKHGGNSVQSAENLLLHIFQSQDVLFYLFIPLFINKKKPSILAQGTVAIKTPSLRHHHYLLFEKKLKSDRWLWFEWDKRDMHIRAPDVQQRQHQWPYCCHFNSQPSPAHTVKCLHTCRYMILFCTRSDRSLASFTLQSPTPSAWLRQYKSVMMDLQTQVLCLSFFHLSRINSFQQVFLDRYLLMCFLDLTKWKKTTKKHLINASPLFQMRPGLSPFSRLWLVPVVFTRCCQCALFQITHLRV